MSSLEDRGEDFEKKFAHDAELKFKAEARRNRLLASWAAQKMGINPKNYINEVVTADLAEAGSEDVIAKIKTDFTQSGIDLKEDILRAKLEEFMLQAITQIKTE